MIWGGLALECSRKVWDGETPLLLREAVFAMLGEAILSTGSITCWLLQGFGLVLVVAGSGLQCVPWHEEAR